MRKTDIAFVVGKPEKGKWTGVCISPLKSERSQKLGQLVAVISLNAPAEFDSRVGGDLLGENIQDAYYGDEEELNLTVRLEKAVMSTAKRLEYLLQRERVAAEEGIDLHIEAFVVHGGFVYMAVLGEGKIMLWRGGRLLDATKGLKDLTGRDLIKSGSGKSQVDDVYILFSQGATFDISEQGIERCVNSFNLKGVSSNSGDALFGALMIKVIDQGRGGISKEESAFALRDAEAQGESIDRVEVLDESDVAINRESGDHELDKESTKKGKGKEGEDQKQEAPHNSGDKMRDKLRDKKTYQVFFSKMGQKAQIIGGFLKKSIWEDFLGIGGEKVYLRGAGSKKHIRGIIILIVLAASFLFVSIRGIQKRKEQKGYRVEVEQVLAKTNEEFANGRNLGTAGNIAEAVSILEASMDALQQVKQYGILLEEIEAKEHEGVLILDEIRRVIRISDEDLIVDIAAYIDGVSANDMAVWESTIYVSDTNLAAIYEIGSDTGEVYKIGSEGVSLAKPSSIVFDSEGNLLINDLEKGILRMDRKDYKVETLSGLSRMSVGDVTEIENYKTPDGIDFLYLLKPNGNEVRKMIKYPSGYSLPELRLADTRLDGAQDIEIDGKIYILTKSEGVIRYFGNTLDPYTITGLDKPIETSSCLEVNLRTELVLIGDSGNERIVVVTKGSQLSPNQGKYVAQVLCRDDGGCLGEIEEIVVESSTGRVYILNGNRVYQIGLDKINEYVTAIR